ncbi:MAG: hypothetical protein KDK39_09760 [Leptospiraceae bacterium]|nr:hypothetical protein [Leptospiraceae bacterium]
MSDWNTRLDTVLEQLQCRTDPLWTAVVLEHPLQLLNDHAHLEKKAAANAMELLGRYPFPDTPADWVQKLAAVIQDESSHLRQVLRLIYRRGGRFESFHRNPYASGLHQHIRKGSGDLELLDRLLVSALIELRSCERFALLSDFRWNQDTELRRFYRALAHSESGHFRIFLQLGRLVAPQAVDGSWRRWLHLEADVIQKQARLEPVRMHAWPQAPL